MSAAKFCKDHRTWEQRFRDAQWRGTTSVEHQTNIRWVKKQLAKIRLRATNGAK